MLSKRLFIPHCRSSQILQAKIRRLEHLLHLKDIRVDDLSQKLERARVGGGGGGGFPTSNNATVNRRH